MKTITVLLASLLLTASPAFSSESPAFTAKVSGHGRPMILIPGLSCPGAVWDTTVEHFQDRYECHVLSLAGFAGSPSRPGPVVEPVCAALAAYIREHRLERPVIVGHSLGGFLTLALGTKHPDLAGPLVVVDGVPFLTGMMRPGTTAGQARESAVEMRRHFDAMADAAYEQTIRAGATTRPMVADGKNHERIIAWSLASDRTTVTEAMTELFGTDLREDLGLIRSPALVFASWIAYKPYTNRQRTAATFRDQYARLDGVKIIVSDTARHFIMFDEPDWMFAQIESFLSALPASSH